MTSQMEDCRQSLPKVEQVQQKRYTWIHYVRCGDDASVAEDAATPSRFDSQPKRYTFLNFLQRDGDPSAFHAAETSRLIASLPCPKGSRIRKPASARPKAKACRRSLRIQILTHNANLAKISTFCGSLGLQSDVAEEAKRIFRMAGQCRALQGWNRDPMVVVCIFLACYVCDTMLGDWEELFGLVKVALKEQRIVFQTLLCFFRRWAPRLVQWWSGAGEEDRVGQSSGEIEGEHWWGC